MFSLNLIWKILIKKYHPTVVVITQTRHSLNTFQSCELNKKGQRGQNVSEQSLFDIMYKNLI